MRRSGNRDGHPRQRWRKLRLRKAKDGGLWTLRASVGSEVLGSIDHKAHTEPGEHREGVMTRFFMTTISSLL
jgi:hypothetical protein